MLLYVPAATCIILVSATAAYKFASRPAPTSPAVVPEIFLDFLSCKSSHVGFCSSLVTNWCMFYLFFWLIPTSLNPNSVLFSKTRQLKDLIYILCKAVRHCKDSFLKKGVVSMCQTGGLGIDLAGAIGAIDRSRMP